MTTEPLHDPSAAPAAAPEPTSLQAELDAARAELEQLRGDMLRERAELDNQRKRLARDDVAKYPWRAP